MYGLLGYPLGHSFSLGWFTERGYRYQNFEFQSVEAFLTDIPAELRGFSVTIPHKQSIIPFLSSVDSCALEIGAVNCVVVNDKDGSLRGYNTDVIGFWGSLSPLVSDRLLRAAILGSGGASKAVEWVMQKNGIECSVISRQNGGYTDFDPSLFDIIVNATPLGMYPNVEASPPINYSSIREGTICYDLVYNPSDTQFLKECRRAGAVVIGGIKMLHLQAEAALQLFEAPQ